MSRFHARGDPVFGLPLSEIQLGETQYRRLADAQTSLNIVLRVNGKRQPLLVTSRDRVPLIVRNVRPTYQRVAMEHVFPSRHRVWSFTRPALSCEPRFEPFFLETGVGHAAVADRKLKPSDVRLVRKCAHDVVEVRHAEARELVLFARLTTIAGFHSRLFCKSRFISRSQGATTERLSRRPGNSVIPIRPAGVGTLTSPISSGCVMLVRTFISFLIIVETVEPSWPAKIAVPSDGAYMCGVRSARPDLRESRRVSRLRGVKYMSSRYANRRSRFAATGGRRRCASPARKASRRQ